MGSDFEGVREARYATPQKHTNCRRRTEPIENVSKTTPQKRKTLLDDSRGAFSTDFIFICGITTFLRLHLVLTDRPQCKARDYLGLCVRYAVVLP